ncbi:ferric-chelate reductase [Purpureocillium lavendulum]|uniref:Ferric-chelate reductase n=1 Tax=Purpureocillium lavendulum TaxID=1247861 RepID=A0AB34FTC8_9HYPO|nr:ferric-chelate reductase [Purpureocillium lavendulum]
MSYQEALQAARIDERNTTTGTANGTQNTGAHNHSRRLLVARHGGHDADDEPDTAPTNSSLPTIKPGAPLNVTSFIRKQDWQKQYNGFKSFEANEAGHSKYTIITVLVAVLLPVVVSVTRFVPSLARSRTWAWANSVLVYPPLWGDKHRQPTARAIGGGFMPTRGQSWYILVLLVLNIIFLVAPYENLQPQSIFSTLRALEISTIGNRAGVMAMGNVVVLILFAGRNNPLLALTGWNYDTYLLFHRVLGYLAIFHTVLHSLMLLSYYKVFGGYDGEASEKYWIWGAVATVAACLLWPASVLAVRKRFYEVFLSVHHVLVIIFLVGYFYHIFYRYGMKWGYEIWCYIAGGIWGAERVFRLGRMLLMGWRTATVTEVEGSGGEYIRVDIDGVFANGLVYLYFPTLSWRFWENHPFSVASSLSQEKAEAQSSGSGTPTSSESTKGIDSSRIRLRDVTSEKIPGGQTSTRQRVTIVMRRQAGMTARLAARVATAGGALRLPVLVEGSYHATPSSQLSQCTTLLCIAGGVGVSAVLPLLHEHAARRRLCWCMRTASLLDEFRADISSLPASVQVDTSVGSRLDVEAILREELTCRTEDRGPTGVVVCGPPQMADATPDDAHRQSRVQTDGDGQGSGSGPSSPSRGSLALRRSNRSAMPPPPALGAAGRLLRLLSVLLLLSRPAAASRARELSFCAQACQNCLRPLRFADADPGDNKFARSCHSRLALASTYLCFETECGAEDRAASIVSVNETCIDVLGSSIPAFDIVANYTAGDIARLRRVTRNESLNAGEPFSEPVLPSREHFIAWFETLDATQYVQRHHFYYGMAMVFFWVAVVAVGAAYKLSLVISRLCGRQTLWPTTRSATTTKKWIQRNVTIPAAFGYRCAQDVWWGTIPPRFESITIFVFFLINVALSVWGYRITEVNYYFPTREKQILRHVSDRTGIISFFNFPILWLFGMRNNLAMWLTGWDYGTFTNFHRWVARISTLQAVIHSVGYTWLILKEGGWVYYKYWFTEWFWNAGVIATVFMSLLVVPCSIYWMRRRHYEMFLIIHIVLSIVVLLTMLGHVSIFKNHDFDALFWIPVYIWVLDRLIRVVRIILFSPRSWAADCVATYNPSSNIVRLTVPVTKAAYKVKPGTFFYLMLLDDSRPWESHPFTVAYVSSEYPTKSLSEQAPLLDSDDDLAHGGDDDLPQSSTPCMTFLIRPYDSQTRRLQELAGLEASAPATLRVMVDGPYGHSRAFDKYDHVFFIVGGSGVVTALSYLRALTRASKAPRVEIHWAVREPAFAQEVLNDVADELSFGNVTVDLYVSSQMGHVDVGEIPPEVRQHSRRPDARALVTSTVAKAGSVSGEDLPSRSPAFRQPRTLNNHGVVALVYARAFSGQNGTLPQPNSTARNAIQANLEIVPEGGPEGQGVFFPLMELDVAGQRIKGIFDTGSSDYVVPQAGSAVCRAPFQQCDRRSRTGFVTGAFDRASANVTTPPQGIGRLNTSYDIGTQLRGDFVSVSVDLGGDTRADITVAVASDGVPKGIPLWPILGVGGPQNVAAEKAYPTFPLRLRDDGVVGSSAFGVYSNDIRTRKGSVCFGGVEMSKVDGNLTEVPLLPARDGTFPEYVVQLDWVKLVRKPSGKETTFTLTPPRKRNRRSPDHEGDSNRQPGPNSGRRSGRKPRPSPGSNSGKNPGQDRGQNSGPSSGRKPRPTPIPSPGSTENPILLDTGGGAIDIFPSVVQGMAKALRTTFTEKDGLGNIDCDHLNSQTFLSFGFGGGKVDIQVPLDTLSIPSEAFNERPGTCYLPVYPSDELMIVGQSMLQSAYVVFDIEQKRVLMAPAKVNVTESDCTPF